MSEQERAEIHGEYFDGRKLPDNPYEEHPEDLHTAGVLPNGS